MARTNPGPSWSKLLLKKRLCFKVLAPAPGIECEWSGSRVQMEWKSRGVGIEWESSANGVGIGWESSANGVGTECIGLGDAQLEFYLVALAV